MTLPSGRKSYAQLLPGGPPAGWTMTQYYMSNDCSGEPFISWNAVEELLPETIVVRAGAWAIVPGSLGQRPMKSKRDVGDSGPSPTCQIMSGNVTSSRFDFYELPQLNLLYPLAVN